MPDRLWSLVLHPDLQIRSKAMRYAAGFVIGGASTGVRLLLAPLLHTEFPFLFAYPAIALSAFVGGDIAGTVAVAIGFLIPLLFHWVSFNDVQGTVALLTFLASGGLMTGLVHHLQLLRRKLDDEYMQVLQLRTEFLARVSHELRTPLNVAMGRVQMVSSGVVPQEKVPDALRIAARNLRSTLSLVNDLLEVSKLHPSAHLDVTLAPMDLAEVVTDVVQDARPEALRRGVRISLLVEDTKCFIQGDAERLRQVFHNLVQNAIKFTPQGDVSVRVYRDGSNVSVTVVDGGIGIDSTDMLTIWQPFKQGGPAHHRDGSGLGLGLAIVKQLTESHGGSVRVYSQGRGHGAAFTVVLPCKSVTPTVMLVAAAMLFLQNLMR